MGKDMKKFLVEFVLGVIVGFFAGGLLGFCVLSLPDRHEIEMSSYRAADGTGYEKYGRYTLIKTVLPGHIVLKADGRTGDVWKLTNKKGKPSYWKKFK